MLSPKEAEKELSVGAQLNPGPWVKHSMSVGLNAKLIADKIDILDRNDGYDYMMSLNQKEIARICLTHSYPI